MAMALDTQYLSVMRKPNFYCSTNHFDMLLANLHVKKPHLSSFGSFVLLAIS
jgi:hypothetical protein